MRVRLIVLLGLLSLGAQAQILTREDSLNAGLTPSHTATVISSYGEAKATYDTRQQTGRANLQRFVLFLGHRFNSKVTFFSETEIENSKVDAEGGEIALEQAFLKFNLSDQHYLTGGLFIPRMGILNENHLPNTFQGVERTMLETVLIPATWREVGIGYYGNFPALGGLNLSFALTNGLNAAGFTHSRGIRDGRYEGRDASIRNVALWGSALYYIRNFRLQASGYYGGSVGLSDRAADSLGLTTGTFGTPVSLGEVNAQYISRSWRLKALAAIAHISQASKINAAYANNCPSQMRGYYVEAAYNVLSRFSSTSQQLFIFGRYENLQMAAQVPENGIRDLAQNQRHVVTGISYLPIPGVIIKADVRLTHTGTPNPQLVVSPFPRGLPYYTDQTFVNLGLGYSF